MALVILTAVILLASSMNALLPKHPYMISVPVVAIRHISTGDTLSPSHQASRGEPAPRIERRVMKITAYTARDKGMNGKGITANGEKAIEGRTIAADASIPFGTEIYIPALGKAYTVTDRGGAIHGNRLDLYIEHRKDAIVFGVQELEVLIKY